MSNIEGENLIVYVFFSLKAKMIVFSARISTFKENTDQF